MITRHTERNNPSWHCQPARPCGRMMGFFLATLFSGSTAVAEPSDLLLDDFARDDGRSALGTDWQGFTDWVMGGLSDMQAARVETEHGPALRLRGTVRLENNGGFIQVRLPLAERGQVLDGRNYAAFRVELRGAPGAWYLHLRTPDCRRPWQYYRAALPVTDAWTTVTVPLEDFSGKCMSEALDPARLSSVAIVAYGEAFDADIEVGRLELVATP